MGAFVQNVHDAGSWFEVFHTTKQSQTAVMTLPPRGESSEAMNTHERSDQVVLVLEGEIEAQIGTTTRTLQKGDTCIIPSGTAHRLINPGKQRALTFNVYTPPEYPPGESE